jgi:hypothetical protein
MSDEAVEAKTGKTWSRWFKHLDAAGARKMTHQEIVAHLRDKHDVRPWWQQMVAVTYEQARGLREIHEKPSWIRNQRRPYDRRIDQQNFPGVD